MEQINDNELLEEIKEKKEKTNLKSILNNKKLNEFELDKLMNQAEA